MKSIAVLLLNLVLGFDELSVQFSEVDPEDAPVESPVVTGAINQLLIDPMKRIQK